MIVGVKQRLERASTERVIQRQVERVESYLKSRSPINDASPVLVFNASTRIRTLSLNGAFSLLAAWTIRATGIPVRQLVCHAGMHQCMLGTNPAKLSQPPPCEQCTGFSGVLFPDFLSVPIGIDQEQAGNLSPQLAGSSLEELRTWNFNGLNLGGLCLPTVRWALRRHNLQDDEPTRILYRQYLLSAASLSKVIRQQLDKLSPRAMVLFNGVTYPEAIARALGLEREIPVVTHEVGLRPLSAFFSHDHATFRAVDLPNADDLDDGWESDLKSYLSDRRQGQFTMAGVRFWSEIETAPNWLESKMAKFDKVVSVFTNVAFDTSQVHANTIFKNMFDWLGELSQIIQETPETLFVVRAHPDEDRPGKESMESVADWFAASRLRGRENVAFISPAEAASSYELIERSQLVLVYNSSIGLEAAIHGLPVLCAGRARYADAGAVFLPDNHADYLHILRDLLAVETINVPDRFSENGRLFLYRELNQASLDLSDFLEPYPSMQGMVSFRNFEPHLLDDHPTLRAIQGGILEGTRFIMPSSASVAP